MQTLKSIGIILTLLLAWTALMFVGTLNGFLLRPITQGDTSEAFINAAQEAIEQEFVGNLALALIADGEVTGTFFHSVDKPVDENTLFQMASVSKWVTAWGVLSLVEQGMLDLDVPVDTYLTRWHLPPSTFDNEQVTIRRLLSHTGGLVDGLGYAGFQPGETVQSIEASLTQAADAWWSEGVARVGHEPGSRYMYSGASYTLLQLLIEEVSGQSFQDYMTESIFKPLQMNHSTFVWEDSSGWDLATFYDSDGSKSPHFRFTALAAASLYTTASDLALFLRANFSANPVLSSASLELMYTAHAFRGEAAVHALGPIIYAKSGEGVIIHGHDGNNYPAINTAARINRATKDGIIVLSTGNPSIASILADHWIFWKTGIADYVVFMANKNRLLTLLLLGYAALIGASLYWIRKQRQHRQKPLPLIT